MNKSVNMYNMDFDFLNKGGGGALRLRPIIKCMPCTYFLVDIAQLEASSIRFTSDAISGGQCNLKISFYLFLQKIIKSVLSF